LELTLADENEGLVKEFLKWKQAILKTILKTSNTVNLKRRMGVRSGDTFAQLKDI
jgi:hypothetical protein